jgi:hypothetical protein
MDRPAPQTLARLAGALFLITFATSIPAVLLYHSILNDTDFILGGAGSDTPVFLGAFLELLLLVATSVPRWRCSRSSSARTRASRSATSPLA